MCDLSRKPTEPSYEIRRRRQKEKAHYPMTIEISDPVSRQQVILVSYRKIIDAHVINTDSFDLSIDVVFDSRYPKYLSPKSIQENSESSTPYNRHRKHLHLYHKDMNSTEIIPMCECAFAMRIRWIISV